MPKKGSSRTVDLTGERYGTLTVIECAGKLGRFAAWLCSCTCGRALVVRSDAVKRQLSCGQCNKPKPFLGKTGSLHPKWKGGKSIRDGYVWLYVSPGKYVAEHRATAERELGRPLKDDEIVHHRNEIRADNAPKNLGVMTRSKHAKHHGLGIRTRGGMNRAIKNAKKL